MIGWLAMVLIGCGGGGAQNGQVRDAARYEACSRKEPPAARSGSSGSVSFNLLKRTLTLKPGAAEARVAVFSGSDLFVPSPDVIEYLRQTQADVFIVLGGLGRTSAQAIQTARALESLQRLVLVVRGGADSSVPESAMVLDGSALRSVRVGRDALVLWAGADQGRYALDAARCGFGEAELQSALQDLGAPEPGERRWFLTWQAPAPGSALAGFVSKAGVDGVLYAWPPQPEVSLTAWDPAHPLLVPRAWGPSPEGADGRATAPGAVVLHMDPDGPRIAR